MSTATLLLIILAAVLAAALALGQYYFKKRQTQWGWFAFFRFLTYLSVFLLLINPKFRQKSYTAKKPVLVLAVDNSSSIKDFDESDNVRKFVRKLQENKQLQKKFDITTYTFGTRFMRSDSLHFSETHTDINAVFENLQKLYASQTAPTVLITDGNQTFGHNYEFRAKAYSQPLYSVVVGDTTAYTDLKITRLNVNHYAFLHNKFPVEIFVNYEGNQSVSKEFKITRHGKTLFRKELHFGKKKKSTIVQALLTAQKKGVVTYEATITPLKDEKNTTNNRRKFAVNIIDKKTNVLILSSFPHPDLGNFKKSIEHQKQRKADIKYVGKGGNIDYGKYQLIILYQPNSAFKHAFDQIKELGLNTFIVTGTATDYAFLNKQQSFFHKEITQQTENYLPVYNPGYESFQFKNIDFAEFPPLKDKFGAIKMKKNHQTLLYQKIDGITTKTPLLATVKDGQRHFGFLFGENFWQWRAKSYRETGSFETFDNFFGKLIQYLASQKRRERLAVQFKSFYNVGDKIIFRAQYFDANYKFDPRATLYAELRNRKTRETRQMPFLLKNDHYELDLSNIPPGEYTFTVHVKGENLSKSGSFTIVNFEVEKQFLNADMAKLKRVSNQGVYFLNKENALVQQLLTNDHYKAVQKEKITNSPLIDWWYLLIIIVLSLSAEWFMRKYRGLI